MRKQQHLHEQRSISFVELGALLGVREMLKRDLLEFDGDKSNCPVNQHKFHMGTTMKVNQECGSVGCIGGMMGMLMGKSTFDSTSYVNASRRMPIGNLFFPPENENWDKATPAKAVEAIDNWLDTGLAQWSKLLRD